MVSKFSNNHTVFNCLESFYDFYLIHTRLLHHGIALSLYTILNWFPVRSKNISRGLSSKYGWG